MVTTYDYDAAFYDVIRPGCQSSARAVAPILHRMFGPSTAIDVGCGEGWWGSTLADLGVTVTGLDGDYVPDEHRAPGVQFRAVDLVDDFDIVAGDLAGDLVICLEVAEHLPAERAPGFIEDLCTMAPVVAFSAAPPGQGGAGHVNEQWPAYWAHLFELQGFEVSGELRWQLWDVDDVEVWYRQNLLVAIDPKVTTWPGSITPRPGPPLAVVHPILFDARRA